MQKGAKGAKSVKLLGSPLYAVSAAKGVDCAIDGENPACKNEKSAKKKVDEKAKNAKK